MVSSDRAAAGPPDKTRGDLPPTDTHVGRWWMWLPTPGWSCDGFLHVTQIPRKGGAAEEHAYQVSEIPPLTFGWRSFALVKLGTKPGDRDERRITRVGPGGKASCTCRAGRHRFCLHRDSMRALLATGRFPPTRFEGA